MDDGGRAVHHRWHGGTAWLAFVVRNREPPGNIGTDVQAKAAQRTTGVFGRPVTSKMKMTFPVLAEVVQCWQRSWAESRTWHFYGAAVDGPVQLL
jgi:hypothetical protein